MALRILTAAEVGGRVAEVRRRVGLGSVAMSRAMGEDKQFISRYETGKRKRWDRAELAAIASFAEGKGDFVDTPAQQILHFLEGDLEWDVKLRPKFASLGPEGGATNQQVSTEVRLPHLALVA